MGALTLTHDISIVKEYKEERRKQNYFAEIKPITVSYDANVSLITTVQNEIKTVQSFENMTKPAFIEMNDIILTEAINDIARYVSFPPSWDGYKAPVFSSELVELAEKIISDFSSHLTSFSTRITKISPCPCPDGSIDLEFATVDKSLMVNLSSDLNEVSIYFEDLTNDENIEEHTFKIQEAPLAEYFSRFRS